MRSSNVCDECGNNYITTDLEITHHVKEDGTIDYDADSEHVAYGEPECDECCGTRWVELAFNNKVICYCHPDATNSRLKKLPIIRNYYGPGHPLNDRKSNNKGIG